MKNSNTAAKEMQILTPEEARQVIGGGAMLNHLGSASIDADGGLLKTIALGVTGFGLLNLCLMTINR